MNYLVRLNNGAALCFPRGLHQNVYSVCPDDEATRFPSVTAAVQRAVTSGLRMGQIRIEPLSASAKPAGVEQGAAASAATRSALHGGKPAADPGAGRKTTLADIEAMTARVADASNALDEQLAVYEAELQAVNDKHLRPLKRLASIVAQAEAELHTAIEGAPHLFQKPRKLNIHGLTVGLSVSEGKLVWDDEELVIKLLKKKFPDQVDVLIGKTEKVNKDAVKALGLEDAELAKLGCRIEDRGDMVLIKRSAGDIEKLLARLKTKLVEAIVEAA